MQQVNNLAPIFDAAGQQHNVDPALLQAISMVESGGNPNVADSSAGAQGLMQFMPATAAEYGVQNPRDPMQAIPGAAAKMRDLLNQYGSVPQALMGYNAGNPSRWNNPETQAYVGKVAAAYTQLKGQNVAQAQPANDPFSVLLSNAHAAATASPQGPSHPSIAGTAQAASMPAPAAQGATPPAGQLAIGTDPFSTLLANAAQSVSADAAKKASLTPGFINGLVRSVANGLTFGYADKLDAATQSMITGQPYDQAVSDQRQMDSNFSDANPVISAAGNLAGNVGGMLVGGEALAGTKAAGALSSLPLIPRSAAIGAGIGALSSAGNTDGTINDQIAAAAQGSLTGGALGGALGVVAPVIGATVGRGAQALIDRYGSAPDSGAGRLLAQALQRDGITPQQLQSGIAALGPDAAAVDAGGANVRNLAESVANSPGPGAQQAQSFLEGRMQGQGDRINGAINTATGGDANFHTNLDNLMTQRATAAAPLYEAALNGGAVYNNRIQQFLEDPILQQGLRQGIEIQRLESLAQGTPFNPTDYAITDFNAAGDPVIGSVPNMRTLDAAKKGLDNILEQYRDPTTGRLVLDQRGRAIDQVRQAFLKQIDAINPTYAQARASWAGPSQAMDALAAGRDVLNQDPEVIAKIRANLGPANQDFFLTGVARALKDKVGSTADSADATRRIFGNSLIRQKLQAAIGDPEAFQQFQQAMQRENQFAQTRNEVLKGSQTARREAGQQDATVDPNPLINLLRGRPVSAAAGFAKNAYNALTSTPAVQNEQLGNMLFSPGGAGIGNNLANSSIKLQASQALKNKLLMLGSGALGTIPNKLQFNGQNP